MVQIPIVEYGFAAAEERGWVKVPFKMPMPSNPVLITFIEYREGWFSAPSYSAPRKTIDISYPETFEIEIPRISREDMRERLAKDFEDNCNRRLGDWGAFNWMKEKYCRLSYYWGYIVGAALNFIWDRLIQPQVDKIQDNINYVIDRIVTHQNRALRKLVDEAENGINEGLEWTANNIEKAVNQAVEKLYEATGMEKGMLMSPSLVRNITPLGFEFYSLGKMKLHYFAIAGLGV